MNGLTPVPGEVQEPGAVMARLVCPRGHIHDYCLLDPLICKTCKSNKYHTFIRGYFEAHYKAPFTREDMAGGVFYVNRAVNIALCVNAADTHPEVRTVNVPNTTSERVLAERIKKLDPKKAPVGPPRKYTRPSPLLHGVDAAQLLNTRFPGADAPFSRDNRFYFEMC